MNKLRFLWTWVVVFVLSLPYVYAQGRVDAFVAIPVNFLILFLPIFFWVVFSNRFVGGTKKAVWLVWGLTSVLITIAFGRQHLWWDLLSQFINIRGATGVLIVNTIILSIILGVIYGFVSSRGQNAKWNTSYFLGIILVSLWLSWGVETFIWQWDFADFLKKMIADKNLFIFAFSAGGMWMLLHGLHFGKDHGGRFMPIVISIAMGAAAVQGDFKLSTSLLIAKLGFASMIARQMFSESDKPWMMVGKGIGAFIVATFVFHVFSVAFGIENERSLMWDFATGKIGLGQFGAGLWNKWTSLGWYADNWYVWGLMGIAIILSLAVAVRTVKNDQSMLGQALRHAKNYPWAEMMRIGVIAKTMNFFKQAPRFNDITGQMNIALYLYKVEIYSLLNYLLRYETFLLKKQSFVKNVREKEEQEVGPGEEAEDGDYVKIEDILTSTYADFKEVLKTGIQTYMVNVPPKDIDNISNARVGGNRAKILIYNIMDRVRAGLRGAHNGVVDANAGTTAANVIGNIQRNIDTTIKNLKSAHKNAKGYLIEKMGYMHLLRSKELWYLDQYHMEGEHRRGARFARETAIPLIYVAEVTRNGRFNALGDLEYQKLGEKEVGFWKVESDMKFRHEIDSKGFFCEDQNDVKFNRNTTTIFPSVNKEGKPIQCAIVRRIVQKEDICYSNNPDKGKGPWQVMKWATNEWSSFVKDLYTGIYHPWSRTYQDYENQVGLGSISGWRDWAFGKPLPLGMVSPRIREAMGSNGHVHPHFQESPTYDREHLKYTPEFTYWGRQYYNDEDQDDRNLQDGGNPSPYNSLVGQYRFLRLLNQRVSTLVEDGIHQLSDVLVEADELNAPKRNEGDH